MVTTLIDFLEARLAEDEAAAQAAINPERPGTHWHWVNDETDEPIGDLDEDSAIGGLSLRTLEKFVRGEAIGSYVPSPLPAFVIYAAEDVIPGAGDVVARHDPARVLREVTAKRAIIAEHQETGTAIWWPDDESIEFKYCIRCTHDPYHPDESESRPAPCPTLKALAAIYSDHEAYRDEWRP